MSVWLAPDRETLREVIAASRGHLVLASPFVSSPALHIVEDSLPKSVGSIEFWTKLDARDWLTGASDPEGLLEFVQAVQSTERTITLRHSDRLHAKIIVSGGGKALAGSANLTLGGYLRNIEAARLATGSEVPKIRALVDSMRGHMTGISHEQFAAFVAECTSKTQSKEALIDLIREEAPSTPNTNASLAAYKDFLEYVERQPDALAGEIHRIANNLDGNNNTGKVKQAFYGVQRFLQEYPRHRAIVESIPNEWFEYMDSPLASDWLQFLSDNAEETNADYQYSIPTLRRYLPQAAGGTIASGGGGNNELKRVWPLVGRFLVQKGI